MDQQATRLFRHGHAHVPTFVVVAATPLGARALASLSPVQSPAVPRQGAAR